MQSFGAVLNNHALIISLLSCVLAQLSKVVVELIYHGKLNFRVIFESGGMPSSHSALVTALATDIGLRKGLDSGEFAIATVFAIIVMYDAAGVRQAAGKQAKILNQMIEELFTGDHHLTEIHLKELLGHTPFQVLIGSVMGVVIACISEIGSRG
ncbi:MAG: divergent PAP2 family protein [Cyanobacteria bacterium]|nr:divergent PAP2 family protein [Cyanobacteriota bacterium]